MPTPIKALYTSYRKILLPVFEYMVNRENSDVKDITLIRAETYYPFFKNRDSIK